MRADLKERLEEQIGKELDLADSLRESDDVIAGSEARSKAIDNANKTAKVVLDDESQRKRDRMSAVGMFLTALGATAVPLVQVAVHKADMEFEQNGGFFSHAASRIVMTDVNKIKNLFRFK